MDYQQLDFARFETRFLRLVERPPDQRKPMRFEVVTDSLSTPPKYCALSYHWGTIERTSSIHIGEKVVRVPQNLADALYRCDLKEDSLLWADCICINQDDLYEKSYQVNLMGQIYSKAVKTIVWLGNEHPNSADAADLLEDLAASEGDSGRRPPYFRLRTSDSIAARARSNTQNLEQNQALFSKALRHHRKPPRALQGLHELLSRPYWERIWIIQEIAKSREVVVVCGGLKLDLDAIFFSSGILKDLPHRNRTLLKAISDFRSQEQRSSRGEPRNTLLQALIATRHSLATDLRDKVYALLGLASDGSDLVPFPTYTEDVPVIFQRLTDSMIKLQKQTNVVLLSHWVPLSHKYSNRPGWAVDWADLAYNLPPWLTKGVDGFMSRPTKWDGDFKDGKLHTRGRFVGTIENVEGVGRITLESPRPSHYSFSGANISGSGESRMNNVRADVLERLSPGDAAADSLDETALTDVLSRMLRDADKGFPSSSYDFHRVQHVLERLGQVMIDNNPVWEWARKYNATRAADTAPTPTESVTPSQTLSIRTTPEQTHSRKLSWRRGLKKFPESSLAGDVADIPPSPKPNPPSIATFRVLENVIAKLDGYPEYKLRFSTLQNQRLILTCDAALPGDLVYEIDHCYLPVVLRQSAYHMELIGEACLGQNSEGDWLSPANSTLSSISSSMPGSHFQPLTIRLEAYGDFD